MQAKHCCPVGLVAVLAVRAVPGLLGPTSQPLDACFSCPTALVAWCSLWGELSLANSGRCAEPAQASDGVQP